MTDTPNPHTQLSQIPGSWATPGHESDSQFARQRVTALVERFTDTSDVMVSRADLAALLAGRVSEQSDPQLRALLMKHFHDRVLQYATALRELADRIELEASRLNTQPGLRTQPITAVEVAGQIQHAIEWGLANASFSSIIAAAENYDRGNDDLR